MRINAIYLYHPPVVIALRSALLFLIMSFIIFSNTVNIYVLRKSRELQIFSRLLLINLSVAGLVNGFLVCLPGFLASVMDGWPFGEKYCQISSVLNGTSCAVTIWCLTAISLDRYVAIHRPILYRNTNKYLIAFASIAFFWILGLSAFAYPLLHKGDFYDFQTNLLICSFPRHSSVFSIIISVVVYVLSTAILCTSSYKIVRKLKENHQIEVERIRNVKNSRTTRALRVIILSGICFLVSWFPYTISDLLVCFGIIKKVPANMDFVITWLANSNSFMTVLVYSGNSREFRCRLKFCLIKYFEKSATSHRRISMKSERGTIP